MKTSHPSKSCFMLLVPLALAVAGCAGPATTAPAPVARKLAAADYEVVYYTGSHIPVLVPKDPTIRRVPSISPLVILKVEELPTALGSAPFPMH